MKVQGEEQPALVEIAEPGIPSENVVHVVRGEWANLVLPGISQNRIECLGWERSETQKGFMKTRTQGPDPVIVWRPQRRS